MLCISQTPDGQGRLLKSFTHFYCSLCEKLRCPCPSAWPLSQVLRAFPAGTDVCVRTLYAPFLLNEIFCNLLQPVHEPGQGVKPKSYEAKASLPKLGLPGAGADVKIQSQESLLPTRQLPVTKELGPHVDAPFIYFFFKNM